MEMDGHPTQDIVDELVTRGGILHRGTEAGPDPDALSLSSVPEPPAPGVWIFLPERAYDTEIDEGPPAL